MWSAFSVGILISVICRNTVKGQDCQKQVNVTAQTEPSSLFSTNYPRHYENLASCSWLLRPGVPNRRVYVEVVDLQLDDTHGDCGDNLTFHDDGQVLVRLCGSSSTTLVKSKPGRGITIEFRTDGSRTRKGFALRYWAVVEGFPGINYPQCVPGVAEIVMVGKTPQRLDLPDLAAGTSECDFQVETDEDFVLVLKTIQDTSDCGGNSALLFDGPTPTGSGIQLWCRTVGVDWFQSSANLLYIRTKVNNTNSKIKQFGLILSRLPRFVDECTSRAFPLIDVPFNPIFLWIPYAFKGANDPCPLSAGLRSLGPSSQILVTVIGSLSHEKVNCSENYIQVSSYADTMDFLIKPKCSLKRQPIYRSADRDLVLGGPVEPSSTERYLVQLHSDGHACTDETLTIEIPNEETGRMEMDIPIFEKSQGQAQCTYLIVPGESHHLVRLTFLESNIPLLIGADCTDNYFVIYDGHNKSFPRLGEYCGQGYSRPPVFTSTSGSLFVELVATQSGQFVHVKWKYTSFEDNRCNGTTGIESREKEQYLESPAYPNAFSQNLSCVFLITSPNNKTIIVEIIDNGLPVDCSDNITVYDGEYGNSVKARVVGVWCDSENTTLISSSVSILLQLRSSAHSSTSKFRIRYLDNTPRFGSREDPRVTIAIAATVGLANGVGLMFLLIYGICFCRNRSLKQEDEMTFQEQLEEVAEVRKEALKIKQEAEEMIY